MSDKTVISTTKRIYPQIYAYILPDQVQNDGWVKIGYTERENVDDRIKEQTKTAAITVTYDKLWSEPAKFIGSDEWFKDKHFHSYLRKFKQIEQRPKSEWFYYNGTLDKAHSDFDDFRNNRLSSDVRESDKHEYQLREEQKEAVEKTLTYATANPNGKFLWNAKPRFGKTLSSYDLVRKMNAKKALIVTNRPAIANSWYDDFEKFIQWQTNLKFISTADSLKNRKTLTRDDFVDYQLSLPENERESAGFIAFISLQDLKGAIPFGGRHDKLKWVKDLQWDLLIVDESHEGVDTFKTDVAFDNITRNFTLHLSGTPFKAIASGEFSEEQIYNWTYADEQEAKFIWSNAEENNPYERLPQLNMFSYQMSQMITDEINRGAEIDGKDMDFAFDLNEFFATNESGKFIHEVEVIKWLDTLSRNEKYPFSTKELRAKLKHTFWFLNRVASAKALQKLLESHPVFENYKIVLAAGDGRSGDDDQIINQKALDNVRDAIKSHDKTITLSVGQLTTGVTVPEWSAVLMLSNIKSSSLYMQAAFRAQNPWDFEENGEKRQKENAYIFDFAPERTLIIYDEFANNLSKKTTSGGGTTDDREQNIKTLLNFFPVIAEDANGEMVELDVRQVLTIPKSIKAAEVVKRGFMSNFLFQNISGIFASTEAREILEQLNPVDVGKVTPRQTSDPVETKGVTVDENGNAMVDHSIVVSETNARFGEKVYADVLSAVESAIDGKSSNLSNEVAGAFTENVLNFAKELAKENAVTVAQAEQVVKQNASIIARDVEHVRTQSEIRQNEAKAEYERHVADAHNDELKVAEAMSAYNAKSKQITEDFKREVEVKISETTKELTQKSTETILQKAEEKKKSTVEDDVRARLRGFARTIPAFLMAFGTPATTLANFEQNITDSVFKEVTGITLDQFRTLRDTYEFFDSVVFDESISEFLRKKEKLADYFDESLEEDIFDYIPNQKTNQIFTPKRVVKMMIDMLEEENPNIWSDKDKTFVNLYIKSGMYMVEIVKRLYKGLEKVIPDKNERLKHILENQVFGFAPTEIIYNIAKTFIYGNHNEIDTKNLQCKDLTDIAKNGGDLGMKFDVVVGNPPYQADTIGNNAQAAAIYNFFYEMAEKIAPKYCLISPARFLSNQGTTPKDWNKKMLNDEHLIIKYFNIKSNEVFQNTDIKGGVVIVYRDEEKDFGAIETFIPFDELRSIYQKVKKASPNSISSLIYSPDSYRFTDELLSENTELIGRTDKAHSKAVATVVFDRYPEIFFDKKPDDKEDYVQIFGRKDRERLYKYVKRRYIAPHPNLDKWKIFVPGANGSGAVGEVLSTPVIGHPVIGHSQTFLSMGNFETEFEAAALLNFIKTKFARAMLGIMKTTQHNESPNTWSKVPLQDFTQHSDIDWTQSVADIDKQLYAKYRLNKKEVAFIEEKVKAME